MARDRPPAAKASGSRLDGPLPNSENALHVLVHRDVAGHAQSLHVLPVIVGGVATLSPALALGVRIKEQAVALLVLNLAVSIISLIHCVAHHFSLLNRLAIAAANRCGSVSQWRCLDADDFKR